MIPGDTVALSTSGGSLQVQARVRSVVPLEKVTLYFNGKPVEEIPLGRDRKSAGHNKE